MLRDCVKGQRTVTLEASSAQQALEKLLEQYPLLKFHLLDGEKLRTHLVIMHNGIPIHPLASSDVTFTNNQEIHILQAVSGG
jgi:adenylyltransferase/sulfurtransferase